MVDIQLDIRSIERDASLYEERDFDRRLEAIDFLEFHVLDPIEHLLQKTDRQEQLLSLKYHAEQVKARLEEIDNNLFEKLRKHIRTGKYAGQAFENLVREYVDFNTTDHKHQEEPGYDHLDIFINNLFPFRTVPEQTKALAPEMVYYQKTPARIVFELIARCPFRKEDVFFDLGSGLGQVTLLVNLLTGVTAKGVEFEPAFCAYARDSAAAFNLSNVTFINTDARSTDYSEGTVFFMYTPFDGSILKDVLELLRKEALLKELKIITYGPCTAYVALQGWLKSSVSKDDSVYKLGIFTSL